MLAAGRVDERHAGRRHTLDPALEARASLDGLARADAGDLAAVPVEGRAVGERLAEPRRGDLERVTVRNHVVDLEQRPDVVVDRHAVVVRDALVAVDRDAQHRLRAFALELPAHELEPLGPYGALDSVADLFVIHS